jgi:hypothetical protein
MTQKIAEMTRDEFKCLIADSIREAVEDVLEDLMALQSPNFFKSIEESRREYERGEVRSLEELEKEFGV